MTQTDSLFAKVQQGDQEAFGQLYEQLSRPVFTICWRILQSKEAAEDVTHDVFVKLYTAAPETKVRNVRAWVFQIAHNMAVDALRRNARPPEAVEIAPDVYENIHRRMDLEAAFGGLEPQERAVVTLHLNAGLTFEEVGRIVGLSLPAVYRRYKKALDKLKKSLNGGML